MWWAMRPDRDRTWSVSPALVANDATACSASWGSKGGVPNGNDSGISTSHETNGRPEMSRATSISASSSG